MADIEPTTSRRGFLGHVAGAYLAAGAVTAGAVLIADPVLDAVTAYRDEAARLNAMPEEISEDEPQPVWEALENGGTYLPAATTQKGAIEALRLALEIDREFSSTNILPNLMQAALGFLEAQAG